MTTVYEIPVVKAKGKFVSVDTAKASLPDEVFKYALFLGLKAIVNRGTTNLKAELFPNLPALEAEAMKVAQEQVASMYEGKTRIVGMTGKATVAAKSKDRVHIEARRLAILYAKDQTRAMHPEIKLSNVKQKEWSALAERYIEADSDLWYGRARESLAKAAIAPIEGMDFVPAMDPDLIAKDMEKKAAAAKKAIEKKEAKEAKEAKATKAKPAKAAKPAKSTQPSA